MEKIVLEKLISNIALTTSFDEEILEKDYYVCLVLKELSKKQKDLKAYFKGGTALYKILDTMKRYSEDIDLTVKVIDADSKTSNLKRLKQSALGYKINGLELMKDKTDDRKGSVTAFYKYDSSYTTNKLHKKNFVQVEATSFTISEPVNTYTISPLVYKYATDDEKKILRENYNISEFNIDIITLERIFIDKIFATEFYFIRNDYTDVSKHLYDITTLMQHNDIKSFLKNKKAINKLVSFKRAEEKVRLGGIDSELQIKDFKYLNEEFNSELINAFNRMQNNYIVYTDYRITINEVLDVLKEIKEIIDEK